MKVAYWSLTLALVVLMALFGLEGKTKTTHSRLEKIVQGSKNAGEERLLEVAIPSSATVMLKQGVSYTGELIRFNAINLELAVNDFSEIIPLSEVEQIKFQGDVWRSMPRESRRRPIWRGITIPIEEVPVVAFKFNNPPSTATLNLHTVLNQREFERLSSDTDITIHVIRTIVLNSKDKMTVRIKSAKR